MENKDGKKSDEISMQEICYYVFFSLLFFAKGIGLYDGQHIFRVFFAMGVLFFLAKMIATEYSLYEIGIISLLAVCAFFSYWHTREKGIVFVFMTVAGLKNVPVRRMFKAALAVWCVSYVPVVVLTTLKVIDSPFRVHVRPLVGFAVRWGLGSAHPNVGHIAYLVLVILTVYVLGDKVSWKWCLALFAGNCFIFLYTLSQTGFLMTCFYLAATVYFIYRKNPSKWEYGLAGCVLPACIVISLVLPVVLKGRVFDILNKMLNTRLSQTRRYLTEEKITLFGKGLELNDAVNTLDNSFAFAFMTYGAVTFLVLMAAYFLVIKKFIEAEKKSELVITVTLLITGLSEPFLFNTSFKNLSLIFMGGIIFSNSAERAGAWGKKVCLCRWLDRKFLIGNKRMAWAAEVLDESRTKLKKSVILASVAGAVLWGLCYVITVKQPAEIIVPHHLCDYVDKPLLYLEPQEAEGKEVLGYVDGSTPMVSFDGGAILQIEYYRGLICRFFYGACLGAAVMGAAGWGKRLRLKSSVQYLNDGGLK